MALGHALQDISEIREGLHVVELCRGDEGADGRPSGVTRAYAVSTLRPSMFSLSCTGLLAASSPPVAVALARAARTCASFDMSVLRSTRLISGCAISRPCASTT